jgi:hypothetical protein
LHLRGMRPLTLLILTLGSLLFVVFYTYFRAADPDSSVPPLKAKKPVKENYTLLLKGHAQRLKTYARAKGFSTDYCFLIDINRPSGKNRFFIYDLRKDSITAAGLVAHGSCNTTFLRKVRFSNTPNEGCSSLGKYKVGYKYNGRFGRAYKLHGLDSTNSNAFRRAVVLHAYDCIPDIEIYPLSACNSLGCPMVSHAFLDKAAQVIDRARKPVLLWIY